MRYLKFTICLCFVSSSVRLGFGDANVARRQTLYSNKFLMKADVTETEAREIAEWNGFIFHRQIFDGYYVLKRNGTQTKSVHPSKWKSTVMRKRHPQVESIEQEVYEEHFLRGGNMLETTIQSDEQATHIPEMNNPFTDTQELNKTYTEDNETSDFKENTNPSINGPKADVLNDKDHDVLTLEEDVRTFNQREKLEVHSDHSDSLYETGDTVKDQSGRRIIDLSSDVVSNRSQPRSVTIRISDPDWYQMWYLSSSQYPSMGVYDAWRRGYTGKGIRVTFVDDGVERTHADLRYSFDLSMSYNYIRDRIDPSHSQFDIGHGTNCAGIVAAEMNNGKCIVGIAHGVTFGAVKLLDNLYSHTPSDVALALNHHLTGPGKTVDIYSNSWGPPDDGDVFGTMSSVVNTALLRGVILGRNGKGAIYTWSSGNGGHHGDDCNCDAYANSRYTIAVNSVSEDGNPAFYAEKCTAVLTSTYGGSAPKRMITTTEIGNSCTNDFQGTSAACPVAAGIIALTLEANSNLTWRDVQHLVVTSSNTDGLVNGSFVTNGVGKKVSLYFGFGLLNADKMITNALRWKNVPSAIRTRTQTIYVDKSSNYGNTIQSTYTMEKPIVTFLEHVQVRIKFKATTRGNIIFYLTSPMGTESRLLGSRFNDYSYMYDDDEWTFMTVHSWGESPQGKWKLRMEYLGYEYVHLADWQMFLYGTVTDPSLGIPQAGERGGQCLNDSKCSHANLACRDDIELCAECEDGHYSINNTCTEDSGRVNGFCIDDIRCTQPHTVCNIYSKMCECSSGYELYPTSYGQLCVRSYAHPVTVANSPTTFASTRSNGNYANHNGNTNKGHSYRMCDVTVLQILTCLYVLFWLDRYFNYVYL